MIREEDYQDAFDIILIAGEAKGMAMRAIKEAKKGEIEKANELLIDAKTKFIDVHDIQTNLIVNETRGEKNEVNIIMVHAQDHLTMANLAIEFAKEIIDLHIKLKEVENEN